MLLGEEPNYKPPAVKSWFTTFHVIHSEKDKGHFFFKEKCCCTEAELIWHKVDLVLKVCSVVTKSHMKPEHLQPFRIKLVQNVFQSERC